MCICSISSIDTTNRDYSAPDKGQGILFLDPVVARCQFLAIIRLEHLDPFQCSPGKGIDIL